MLRALQNFWPRRAHSPLPSQRATGQMRPRRQQTVRSPGRSGDARAGAVLCKRSNAKREQPSAGERFCRARRGGCVFLCRMRRPNVPVRPRSAADGSPPPASSPARSPDGGPGTAEPPQLAEACAGDSAAAPSSSRQELALAPLARAPARDAGAGPGPGSDPVKAPAAPAPPRMKQLYLDLGQVRTRRDEPLHLLRLPSLGPTPRPAPRPALPGRFTDPLCVSTFSEPGWLLSLPLPGLRPVLRPGPPIGGRPARGSPRKLPRRRLLQGARRRPGGRRPIQESTSDGR